jgi:hypothetical protein
MVRRAALPALCLGLLSCGDSNNGSNNPWSCTWQCHTNGTSGTATYPNGPNPNQQCTTDHRGDCSNFECLCNQN